MEKLLEHLIVKDENEMMIILNPKNMHWIRMNKNKYQQFLKSPIQKEEMIKIFDSKFNLFQQKEVKEQCNIRSAYIAVTNRCNMRCGFCTMCSSPEVSTNMDLTLQQIKTIVIPKLKRLRIKKIVISGGEPLIRKDIEEILKAFAEQFGKEMIVLQTNGLLLNSNRLKNIQKYIGTMEISIENIFEDEKQFRKIREILDLSKFYELELGLSFVVDQSTRPFIYNAIDLSHEYEAAFTMRIVSLVGRAKENNWNDKTYETTDTLELYKNVIDYIVNNQYFEDYLTASFTEKLEPKRHCGAFGKVLAIHSDGTCYLCANFKNVRYSIGNIILSSQKELLQNLEDKLASEDYLDEFCVDRNSICKDCEVQYFCSGPCIAEVAENKHNIQKISEKCLATKILIKYAMFYYKREKSVEENLRLFSDYLDDNLKKIKEM